MDGFSYFIDLHRRQITTDYPCSASSSLLLGFSQGVYRVQMH
jgi:hypothetical protein